MLRDPMRLRWLLALCLLAPTGWPAAAAESTRLRVGTSGDYPPFSVRSDAALDAYAGFDVAVAVAYARERGLELEWVPFAWPELLEALAAGRFDVAMSGITVRPERSVAGRFSVPLVEGGAVVLVRPGTQASDLDQLDRRGVRIGVNAGGHLERVAQARFSRATLVAIPDNAAVLRALIEGAVDAAVTDRFEAPLWQQQAVDTLRLGPFTRDRKALLLRPDRAELAADLDAWLLARESDGTLQQLRRRYLGADAAASTAAPLAALVAALDERLALMPWVAAAKRRDGLPIAQPAREQQVVEAGLAAVAAAAARAGRPAPPEAALRAFFRAQIEAAKQVQLEAARDPEYRPEQPIPGLVSALRPALLRIDERSAALLVALPGALEAAEIERSLQQGLRSPWLSEASRRELAAALARLAAAPREAPSEPARAPAAPPAAAGRGTPSSAARPGASPGSAPPTR